jgi:hypothetical protein
MEYPVCKNPNCKSYGHAHPNCRCAADMAEGGEVSSFCGADRAHEPQCEYFAEGGQAVPEDAIPVDQFQSSEEAYGTPGQMALAGLEGAAKGIAGPLATLAEVKGLGVKPEDIKGREEENPVIHGAGVAAGLVGGALSGSELTQASLLGKAGAGVAEGLGVQGVKAAAVRLGVENALYALGDEASKAIANDPSSIQAAAAHVGLSGLIGAGGGAALGLASKAWTERIAPKAEEFLKDFAGTLKENAADHIATAEEEPIKNFFRPGTSALKRSRFPQAEVPAPDTAVELEEEVPSLAVGSRAAQKLSNYLSKAAGSTVGGAVGHLTGVPGAGALGAWIGHNSVSPIIKTYLPAIIKPFLNSEASAAGLKSAFDTMEAIVAGESAMGKAAESLFSGASSGVTAPSKQELHELDDNIHKLGENPEAMLALGGQLGHYMPAHQTALAETAQSAIEYLNGKRPMPTKPGILNQDIAPSHAEIAAYQRSLAIAQQPLVVLDSLKKGTLQPQDVQDLQNLYPALVPAIMNKVNRHMIDHMSKGQRVPFKMRWGLSMLMGQPMDALFSPQAIQAAQATHLPPVSPQQQAQAAPKGRSSGINKMGKAVELAQTPSESRQKALNKA